MRSLIGRELSHFRALPEDTRTMLVTVPMASLRYGPLFLKTAWTLSQYQAAPQADVEPTATQTV